MAIQTIPVDQLLLAFIPVAAALLAMRRYELDFRFATYAVARMLVQLTLIGYALVTIFQAERGAIILGVLAVMLIAASWIALNPLDHGKPSLFPASLVSISLGGGLTLALITQGVLRLDPWYRPSYMVPLAGMIFAGSMTAISLAAERLDSEIDNNVEFSAASRTAFRAAMIPVTNSLLAVGLISLPGMMTGQILLGVSPFIAARYQIMVMCMIFGAAGISTACFLGLTGKSPIFTNPRRRPD